MADDSIQVNCPHCGAAMIAAVASGEVACTACGMTFSGETVPHPPTAESAPLSRHAAQQRADDIRVFRRELERLEAEGALQLSAPQRQALAVLTQRNLLNLSG